LLPGIELGELDSGSTEQAYLLTLPDGRNYQLARPLYYLASLLDGERTPAEVAASLSVQIGRPISAEEVTTIVEQKLVPLGIIAPPDDAASWGIDSPFGSPSFGGPSFGGGFGGFPTLGGPGVGGAEASLGIMGRLPVLPARYLEPLANTVKHLYAPVVAVPVLVLIALAHVYAYSELAPRLAEFNPFMIPLAVLLLGPIAAQLTTPWHELGHAAAARYFRAPHGPLGVGLMGLMLVAYVEVTGIWRLPRRQRLVVDLGGVYFQSMAVIVLAAFAWATGDPTALWLVLFLDFAMLLNVVPLFKLDGYWAVSDATGIPNLHQRVGEQLRKAAANVVLQLATWLHMGRLRDNPRLREAAAGSRALDAYGTGGRVVIAIYSTLFLVFAVYFSFMLIMFLPILVISYPMLAGLALMAVVGLLSGSADLGMSIMVLLQFVFATLMLVALAGMLLPLALRALGRGRRPAVPSGMAWHDRG
jgi:putative peptide zinc metalloprotease protein